MVYDFYFDTHQCLRETVDTEFLGSEFINWRLCIISLPPASLCSVLLGSTYQSCSFFPCFFKTSQIQIHLVIMCSLHVIEWVRLSAD